MSYIGATGINSFQDELNEEIENTSNYIKSVVSTQSTTDSGFNNRITSLETSVGSPSTRVYITEPTITTGTYVKTHIIDEEYKCVIYKHDGSSNSSSSYSIDFNDTNGTICDIMVIAGGGGGGGNEGGGGGAGCLTFLQGATIPNGTYNISVGKGGAGGSADGSNGNNSSFLNTDASPVGITSFGGGGGAGNGNNGISGGSGGGGSGASTTGGSNTNGVYNASFTKSSINFFGNNGDTNGGGGGAGSAGSTDGGIGLKGITSLNIDFKTHFDITDGTTGEEYTTNNIHYVYFAGGGGFHSGNNGLGNVNIGASVHCGGGKGGGSGDSGENGGDGLVIIRYKYSTLTTTASGISLELDNIRDEIGDPSTISPLYLGTGMHREITLLEQGVGIPSSSQSIWWSQGNGLYGITDSIMTQLGMTDYAVGANASQIFATQLSSAFATLLGWSATATTTVTIADAINKLDERITKYEDTDIEAGDYDLINDRSNDTYFLNSGNIGIGYNKNDALSKKFNVSGDINITGDLYKNGSLIQFGEWDKNTNDIYYNTGNVGIGDFSTTAPSKKLDVDGDINITGDLYKNGSLILFGSKWTDLTGGSGIFYNGKVAVGNYSSLSTSYKLEVDGDAYFKDEIRLQATSSPNLWLVKDDGSGNLLQQGFISVEASGNNNLSLNAFDITGTTNPKVGIVSKINNSTKMTIFNNGNVAIGSQTTAPNYKFEVDGDVSCSDILRIQDTTNPQLWLERQDASGNTLQNAYLYVSNVSPHNMILNHYDASGTPAVGIDMRINNSQVLKIENNGNTRIGAYSPTPPAYKLEVVGDINITSGDLYKNGVQYNIGNYENLSVSSQSTTINTIEEPRYPNSSYITRTNVDADYRYIKFENDGNNQTSFEILFPESTICDILVVGGGGGGGYDRGGGGGAGACIVYKNYTMSGKYNIKVGKGGVGQNYAGGYNAGQNGLDSEITSSTGTVIIRAKGGGGGAQHINDGKDGGCGGGAGSQSTTHVGGIAVGNIIPGYNVAGTPSGNSGTNYVVYGSSGGSTTVGYTGNNLDALDGAGGGGIGGDGQDKTSTLGNDGAIGGAGRYNFTVNSTTYTFNGHFGITGEYLSGNYYIGGGGGGGDMQNGSPGGGGGGGGGSGGDNALNGSNGSAYGAGGGGGGGNLGDGGAGFAGVIVIRYKYSKTATTAYYTPGGILQHKVLPDNSYLFKLMNDRLTEDPSFFPKLYNVLAELNKAIVLYEYCNDLDSAWKPLLSYDANNNYNDYPTINVPGTTAIPNTVSKLYIRIKQSSLDVAYFMRLNKPTLNTLSEYDPINVNGNYIKAIVLPTSGSTALGTYVDSYTPELPNILTINFSTHWVNDGDIRYIRLELVKQGTTNISYDTQIVKIKKSTASII